MLVDVAQASGAGLTPPQRAQVAAAVWSVVEAYLRARPRRAWTVLRTILRRGRQALYTLGAAGIGVTLTAAAARTLQGITLVASFAACLAVLLLGLVIELLEGSLEE